MRGRSPTGTVRLALGPGILLLLLLLSGAARGSEGDTSADEGDLSSDLNRPFPLVEPVDDHTKLAVSEEGLDVIRKADGPVGAVVVIGPYRSGKSFLLNQLLGVPCDKGFGVGHERHTQTKGMWVWGQPREVVVGGQKMKIFFVDTEGFESTGKSDVYDDRIFALSSIISSVLIYNLPETVREADIEKLSFAVELGEEFYHRAAGRSAPFEPGSLLWLIQRDFLEGSTVQQMVTEALQPVKNPYRDADIENVNRIRRSLALMARNNTAFGLAQRTKLCELADDQLEPKYVEQRGELKKLVQSMCTPKVVGSSVAGGDKLADLIRRSVEALNKGKIPSAGSVVESFNRDVLTKAGKGYAEAMGRVRLPVREELLGEAHEKARAAALELFRRERFGSGGLGGGAGGGSGGESTLESEVAREYKRRQDENRFASSKVCEELEGRCVDELDDLLTRRLPSMGRLESRFRVCNGTFESLCVGPSKAQYRERINKAWAHERALYQKDYNAQLLAGMEVAALGGVVVFRLLIKSSVLELACLASFIFLQIYPRFGGVLGGVTMYESRWWKVAVRGWEAAVYNPLWDLERFGAAGLCSAAAFLVWWRFIRRWTARRRSKKLHTSDGEERDMHV